MSFVCRDGRDDSDQEYVALAAMLLCGELEIRQDTFQAITNKPQVDSIINVLDETP